MGLIKTYLNTVYVHRLFLWLFSVLAIMCVSVVVHQSAHAGSVVDAQNFASHDSDTKGWCPENDELAIADYMWITNTGGGMDFTVVDGQSQDLPITINFYTTYCKKWPKDGSNGAADLGIYLNKDLTSTNRLSSAPASRSNGSITAQVFYGSKTSSYGVRSTWGPASYGGTINVSGWQTGDYFVCTAFTTVTSVTWDTPSASPSDCQTIHLTRLPPPDYNLAPQINSVSPNPIEAGSKVSITSQINYSGNTPTRPTQWQINQIVIKPGGVQPSNRGGGTSAPNVGPCTFYGKPPVDCNGFGANGNGTYSGSAALPAQTSPSLDYPVGTEVCYGLSVQPRAYGSDDWVHSALECTVIGIKPKVQVLGSDLMVGRAFAGQTAQASSVNTGITIKNGQTFGSWVEYGIFAPSGIAMASGSGLADPAGGSPAASEWNKLTFANVAPACPSSAYGCYNSKGAMGLIPDVAGRLMSSGSSALPNPSVTLDSLLNGLPDGTYIYTAGNANISIKGNIPKGKSVVIKTNGTVTIDGNITYDSGKIDTIAAIPQLVLMANVIQINEGVDHVDSWLIARSTGAQGTGGRVDTCNIGGFATSLSSGMCNKVLTINGPIMAEDFWLRRTGGSGIGVDSGKPAEILNMRADTYLWALSRAQGNGRVQTVYTQEMAPRF